MDNLPLEIVQHIVRYLPREFYYNLARTSKRLYPALLLHLYHEVSFGHSYLEFWKVACFFQTVTKRPELASAVHTLSLPSWETGEDDEPVLDDSPWNVPAAAEKMIQEIAEFPGEIGIWQKALHTRNTDALLALLLTVLSNLQTIHIEFPYGAKFFNKVLEKGARGGIPSLFPKLSEAYLSWYDTENGVDASDVVPFFSSYFPTMRKLHGYQIAEHEPLSPIAARPPPGKRSGIQEIVLENSNSANGMMEWIQSCRELKTFRFEHGGALVSEDYFAPEPFGKSLALHKTSLERITIHDPYPVGMIDEQWIGSWADYTVLKELRLRLPNLIEINESFMPLCKLRDILPPSLEHLFIWDCRVECRSWLSEQLEELIQCAPNLTRLDLEDFHPLTGEKAGFSFTRLQDLCEEAGINLGFWKNEQQITDDQHTQDGGRPFVFGGGCNAEEARS